MESKKWIPVIRWTARIWTLVPIFFALGEILFPHGGNGEVVWYEILALSLLGVTLLGLALAWRWERIGAVISLTSLAIFSVLFILTFERIFPTIFIFILALGTPAGMFLWAAKEE
jgi:hypothetical protein